MMWNRYEPMRRLFTSPRWAAIGFTHLQNRLKFRHLDDPWFPKHLDFGRRTIVEKTRLFQRCEPRGERCVHTIARQRGEVKRRRTVALRLPFVMLSNGIQAHVPVRRRGQP
jgi:hypothetical protein